MSRITGEQIKQSVKDGSIDIKPFDENQLQPTSIDLKIWRARVSNHDQEINSDKDKTLKLMAGARAVVITKEHIRLGGQYNARIGLRAKYTVKGLYISSSGQIEPGFDGCLKTNLFNNSANVIEIDLHAGAISFAIEKLDQPVKNLRQNKSNQSEFSDEDIKLIESERNTGIGHAIKEIPNLTDNVNKLEVKVDKLSDDVKTLAKKLDKTVEKLTKSIELQHERIDMSKEQIAFQQKQIDRAATDSKEQTDRQQKQIDRAVNDIRWSIRIAIALFGGFIALSEFGLLPNKSVVIDSDQFEQMRKPVLINPDQFEQLRHELRSVFAPPANNAE